MASATIGHRRAFLTGMAGILAYGAAPSIVRAASLMPIKMGKIEYEYFGDPFWGVGFWLPKGTFSRVIEGNDRAG